ncbi:hypothetical protein Vafri_5952 [Volvox africanus]|nr:hypothetical protein Vafri_5952 [Volvox africanus]
MLKASSWSSLSPSSYIGVGAGGDDYMSVGGGRGGWVVNGGDGNGSGSGSRNDVPLSVFALSQLGVAGHGRTGRIPLSGRTGEEVQRVLGGGVVYGAVVLIGGDRWVGKSTIALQIAAMIAHPELDFDAPVGARHRGASSGPRRTVLYITAEETREQMRYRSSRMRLDSCDRVLVLFCCKMSIIIRVVWEYKPDAVVIDSINRVSLVHAPGTATQIRECGQLLLRLAKYHQVAIFIIAHFPEAGEMASPIMLAPMVDTVLYLEDDVAGSLKVLRVIKNWHGSDAECGIFTMNNAGCHAVANHNALLMGNRIAELQGASGEGEGEDSAVGITLLGSRASLVKVQASVAEHVITVVPLRHRH